MNWLQEDLALAFVAAQRAGIVIMRSFGRLQEVVEKSPGQPLTPADLEADNVLQELLLAERSGYGWLSEETLDRPDRLDAERVWIVDPIDGTRSFIAGYPEFAISIGLAENGRAVAGVVLNPAAGEVYWAMAGGGAYLARLPGLAAGRDEVLQLDRLPGAPIRLAVSQRTSAEELVFFASRSEIAAGEFGPWGGGAGEPGRWRIEPVGSTAYKLVRVAAGAGDVFLSRGPKSEWDICAGALIVAEAGGVATDLRGGPLSYNRPDPRVYGLLASNGVVHKELLDFIRDLPPPPRLQREWKDPLHPGLRRGVQQGDNH